jgi:hypothetical protein
MEHSRTKLQKEKDKITLSDKSKPIKRVKDPPKGKPRKPKVQPAKKVIDPPKGMPRKPKVQPVKKEKYSSRKSKLQPSKGLPSEPPLQPAKDPPSEPPLQPAKDQPSNGPPSKPKGVQSAKKKWFKNFRNFFRSEFLKWQGRRHHHVLSATFRERIQQFWTDESVTYDGCEYGGFQVPLNLFREYEFIFVYFVATTVKVENGVLKLERGTDEKDIWFEDTNLDEEFLSVMQEVFYQKPN